MKRPIFIIVGIILVLILVAIWIYVLFFGTPKNSPDIFNDFSFGDTTDTTLIGDETSSTSEPVVDVTGPNRLRQLTTKPVIGFTEVRADASSTPLVYYIEAGTGHVFSINKETGEEVRISATTFPASTKGSITPDGQFAMIQSGGGLGSEFSINRLASSSAGATSHSVQETVTSFTATVDNTFLYAVQTDASTMVMQYHPLSEKTETLFTVPFREATIAWGDTAIGPHLVYPKASAKLEGFVFQASGGQVKRLPVDGYGLSAAGTASSVLFSKQTDDGAYRSFVYNSGSKQTVPLTLSVLPEKCEFSRTVASTVICAVGTKPYDLETPDTWYRGEASYTDSFWALDTVSQGATFILDTQAVSGQELDVTDFRINGEDEDLYFINKNNQTLWLYEWQQL